MIHPELLVDYMRRFVGFGSPGADLWFIGLEQGGGESLAELEKRLAVWNDLGRGPFADLRDYHLRLDEHRWHGAVPRIQPTLGKLVRLLLASEGRQPTAEAIRQVQAHELGRSHGRTVVAELMPLPSRNVSEWIYSDLEGVPGLSSRDAYVEEYRALRVALLRSAIREASPRAVVFLGLTEQETWSQIVGEPFTRRSNDALWAESGTTRFVVLKHPTAFGAKNVYFEAIGRELVS